MINILITGSQGLIGQALQEALKKENINVIRLDNSFPQDHPDYGDICQPETLVEKIQRCDGVIHLAAVSRVIWGEKHPKLCWQTNVDGTENVLKLAKACAHKPWVIYASSREVYGEPSQLPVNEDAEQISVNYYGESKVKAETLVNAYKDADFNTAIVRFSNVFGNINDHPDRVVPAFCRAAAFGDTIYIEGPDNLFDFTYVDDVASGVVNLAKKLLNHERVPPIHFTSGRATSLMELATIVNDIGGHKAKIDFREKRNFDVSRFYGDTTRAKKILNWAPSLTLESALERFILAFKQSQEESKVGSL